ncbi:AAA family ATPase [Paenibacillus aurantiacus]|uniref:AAA family ATPase n=1 Tax=Paenibacillus aurantiacus TaxID=1936118 RepID=A0ABV5KRG9_9BACL
MRIKSIGFGRFGKLRNFKLKLEKPKVSLFNQASVHIIVGENGTGKTSILKFISDTFYKRISYHNGTDFSIEYDLSAEKDNIISNEEYPAHLPKKIIISTYSPFEQFEARKLKNDFSNVEYCYVGAMSKSPYGSTTSLSSVCMPILTAFYHPVDKKSEAIKELLNEIGVTTSPLVEIRPKSLLMNRDYYEDNGIAQELVEKIYNFPNESDFGVRRRGRNLVVPPHIIDQYYVGGWEQWLNDVRQLLQFKRSISPIQSLWFERSEDSEPIPMNKLSSGELSLFFRFFRMLEVMDDDAIVLIDEPEIHLHPRWILKYLWMIKKVFGQYSSHFIIATHSPLIASDLPREYIVGLKDDNGVIKQYFVDENTMGAGPTEILREVFRLEKYIGKFTLDYIKRINNLIDDNKISEARRLYNELGDSQEKYKLFLRLERLENK